MPGRGLRQSIQVEWFNVTYRSVGGMLVALLLLAGGALGYWYYFHRYTPQADAEAALRRAETRLAEAAPLRRDGRIGEVVDNARAALGEARREFGGRQFEDARVTAIRSETLSLKAITMARGSDGNSRMVRFSRIEGDVRVKRSGEFSWETANPKAVLRIGDQVKTASNASASLIYFDGTVTTIQPGSLLEIRDLYEDPVTMVRRVREKLNWGELHASTQKRNVAGSYHEVSTDKAAARSEEGGEFRVAFDRERQTSEFDVFEGRIQVATANRQEAVDAGERLRAGADGRLRAKETLPGVPRLVAPADQRVFVFDKPEAQNVTLSWETVSGAARYQLVISDKALFANKLYDAERGGTSAVVDGVAPGSYFWKVAALSASGVRGPFSGVRRFRVTSQQIRDTGDTTPPELTISDFVAIGAMVIVNGRTEPGAQLWVDHEKIDVDDSGTFYAVIRLRREGLNELHFVAQDNAGNETTLRRSAYVETF